MLYLTVAGSRLYGTSRTDSDFDLRGVCHTPLNVALGLATFEQEERKFSGVDLVVFDVRKFFRLALAANPSVLDILFAPEQYWLVQTAAWRKIYNHRFLFLTERVRNTFSGYGFEMLKNMSDERFTRKNATHLYRLLVKGYEILCTGDYNPVLCGDELSVALSILNGEFNLEALQYWAKDKLSAMKGVIANLPKEPDYARIEALLIEINKEWLERDAIS